MTPVVENLQDQTRRKDTPKFTPSPGPRRPRPPRARVRARGADDDSENIDNQHECAGHLSPGSKQVIAPRLLSCQVFLSLL